MKGHIAGVILLTYALCYHSLTAFILWGVLTFYQVVILQTEKDWEAIRKEEQKNLGSNENDKK